MRRVGAPPGRRHKTMGYLHHRPKRWTERFGARNRRCAGSSADKIVGNNFAGSARREHVGFMEGGEVNRRPGRLARANRNSSDMIPAIKAINCFVRIESGLKRAPRGCSLFSAGKSNFEGAGRRLSFSASTTVLGDHHYTVHFASFSSQRGRRRDHRQSFRADRKACVRTMGAVMAESPPGVTVGNFPAPNEASFIGADRSTSFCCPICRTLADHRLVFGMTGSTDDRRTSDTHFSHPSRAFRISSGKTRGIKGRA